MPLTMKRVLSSHILDIGYDPDTAELVVRYSPTVKNPSGDLVSYLDVDPKTAESVINAPSIGTALHQTIRGRYSFRQG